MNILKPEMIEHLSKSLQRDYRNARRLVMNEDPDRMTQIMLTRLGTTVNETCKTLADLSKYISETNKK